MLVRAKFVTWRQLMMRQNHKNHIGSRVQVCLWLPSKLEKPRKHIGHQNPKNRFIFAKKPKNQMVQNRKTGNRNGQQNRENEVFQCKNRKTDLQNGQNWKTVNPNAPLLYLRTNEVFLCFLPFVFQSCFVPTSDYSLVLRHPRFLRVLTSKMSLYNEKCIS